MAATPPEWFADIEAALGSRALRQTPLSGGSIAQVSAVDLADGRRVVAKSAAAGLALEADMLTYLRAELELPVPAVLFVRDGLLVMEHLPGSTRSGSRGANACGRIARRPAQCHG